jgi:hypothetical protein
VEVGDRQESLQARLQPVGALAGLALGAVAVAARVVGDAGEAAGVAAVDVPAQLGRAAGGQPAQDLGLVGRQRVTLAVGRPVAAQDVPDLPSGAREGRSRGSLPLLARRSQRVR